MALPALLPLALAAGGGTLLGSLYGRSGETPARNEQLPLYNKQQQNLLSQILGQSSGALQNLQKPFDFSPIENQARTGFQQQTIPSIAERFTSMGGGALSSPAFASQLGQAGAGLETNLAGLKSQIGLQQQGQQQNMLMNLLRFALQPQTENLYHPRQPGIAETVSPYAIRALLAYLTGGSSEAANAGSQVGGGISNLLSNWNSQGQGGYQGGNFLGYNQQGI